MSAPAKATPKKASKPKKPSTHPPTINMVTAAIKALKERNGSSLAAIKKYIAANYKCDVVKLAPFIRKALKNGVTKGTFVMVKASYKMGKKEEKPKKAAKKPAAKKPKKAKTPKKAKKPAAKKSPKKAAKKPKTPKKAAKKPAAKKPAAKKPAAKKPAKKAAPKKK